jgi:hypothetical protein
MQRVAELSLGTPEAVNWREGTTDCSALGYEGGVPTRDDAIKLANEGYYAISCRAHSSRIFDIMEPYKGVTSFLVVLVVVGVTLYFITSSDSGSFIDDILAAQGMPNPPIIQKIFWAFTEGALATGLIVAGGSSSLNALQAVSICAGLPYTFACCFLCTSLYRALKIDQHEEDIVNSGSWSTGCFDWLDLFMPSGKPDDNSTISAPKYTPAQRFIHLMVGMFLPFVHVHKAATALFGPGINAMIHTVINAATFLLWFCLMIAHVEGAVYGYMGWTCFAFFFMHITMLRYNMREAHNIYGSIPEDFFGAMCLYPWIVSQIGYQADEAAPEKNNKASNYTAA